VITATQMLESMVASRLPTRAEATDVANAIFDGTDAVMLSAESAIGRFPVESVTMLSDIARVTEANRSEAGERDIGMDIQKQKVTKASEAIAAVVETALHTVPIAAVFVPSQDGDTARMISRFKPTAWIVAFSDNPCVCQELHFSYGVHPVELEVYPEDVSAFVNRLIKKEQITGDLAILVSTPSPRRPDENYSLQFIKMGRKT
jgi:pyruvate kinase